MPTLQGVSDGDEVARVLDVEVSGDEVLLAVHPPGNTASGQSILVPCAMLRQVLQAGGGRVEGVTPVHRRPKDCVLERRPEGLRVQIQTPGGSGWWVTVQFEDFSSAIS